MAAVKVTLREIETRVCKMIEEFAEGAKVSDDEEILEKLPILVNQGIKKISQAKSIPKFALLDRADANVFGELLLFPLPSDLYRLRKVELGGEEYQQLANGNENYIAVSKHFSGMSIFIRYEAFHPEIYADSPLDTTYIELTQDCLPILENFVAAGLTLDSSEMYSHFFTEYQSGMQNLTDGRQKNLISFSD